MSPYTALRERVRRLPGMEDLLPALTYLPPIYLVGGPVRDLLLTIDGDRAIDLAVEGDARRAARELADSMGGDVREHERFGTAVVHARGRTFDLATTRREVYDQPGALPRVQPAPLTEDLGRRDFTINAMAIGLTGDDLGHLYDPRGGHDDLEAGLVRVLHPHSFLDDPTRLLRAVRFAARLGFALEEDTERDARAAVAEGALDTVSGVRVRNELMLILGELDAPAGVRRMHDLGIDRALHPALDPDPELVASASLGAIAIGADRALAALAALCAGAPEELDLWLGSLQLDARDRDAVARASRTAEPLAHRLRADRPMPSELRALLAGEPRELLALTLAFGAPATPILRWVSGLAHVRLEITGEDLIAAGVPEGPALGRALEETLRRKLDGLVSGRDDELRTALELARGPA